MGTLKLNILKQVTTILTSRRLSFFIYDSSNLIGKKNIKREKDIKNNRIKVITHNSFWSFPLFCVKFYFLIHFL